MSHLRVLICRVDADDDEMTELASVDLPPLPADPAAAPLDAIEARVAQAGSCVLGRLCELQWAELDAQAVARYCARQAPGSVVADGYEPLCVASRFGTLRLRRQVCAHRDGRPHVMPGNDLLPIHHGLLITRGLAEAACLLAQDLPFATAARLLGWQTGEPGILSATTVRTHAGPHPWRLDPAAGAGRSAGPPAVRDAGATAARGAPGPLAPPSGLAGSAQRCRGTCRGPRSGASAGRGHLGRLGAGAGRAPGGGPQRRGAPPAGAGGGAGAAAAGPGRGARPRAGAGGRSTNCARPAS